MTIFTSPPPQRFRLVRKPDNTSLYLQVLNGIVWVPVLTTVKGPVCFDHFEDAADFVVTHFGSHTNLEPGAHNY